MKPDQASALTEHLSEIQRITTVLGPLIEDGREGFSEFTDELQRILEKIFPTYTIAVVGPVGSGKSTVLSGLLREGGAHPIASISPSNETFAPMTIAHGPRAGLVVRFFSVEVLEDIQSHLGRLERQADQPHLVALYREAKKRLLRVGAVHAGTRGREVVKRIDLEGLHRQALVDTVRNHVAQSSNSDDVYGIYKAELTYPGETLAKLRHVRFIDLFGFGEPSPLVKIKYDRFVSEEEIDAVVYVLPDRSVTEEFNNLFSIPAFLDEIVAKRRLFLVLNKADAYTDKGPSQWDKIIDEFRQTLARHSPVLKRYVSQIPIFVLSAASIDRAASSPMQVKQEVRDRSLESLHSLRDRIKELSRELERTSSDPSIYLGSIFELLSSLDVLAKTAQISLDRLERRIPEIKKLVDDISRKQSEFDARGDARIQSFRQHVEEVVSERLRAVDYDPLVAAQMLAPSLGDPRALFRTMLACAQGAAETAFSKHCSQIIRDLGKFVDSHLLAAYREYVSLQDQAAFSELQELDSDASMQIQPLSATVQQSSKDFVSFSSKPAMHMGARGMFQRFVNWYLHERCQWDSNRYLSSREAKEQIVRYVQAAVETFMLTYTCEDQSLQAYTAQLCVGGTSTFWRSLVSHVQRLDNILSDQVRISKWKFGLFQNKRFFVSNKPAYQETLRQLIAQKVATEELILELV